MASKPARMLPRPKNRICPSLNLRICSNIRRQPAGEKNGKSPSIISTQASASQIVPLSTPRGYFFDGAAPAPDPRIALKKSDEGSSTITSLFLLKLAL